MWEPANTATKQPAADYVKDDHLAQRPNRESSEFLEAFTLFTDITWTQKPQSSFIAGRKLGVWYCRHRPKEIAAIWAIWAIWASG